ncbi:peptidase M29 [Gordoniibacillus kamchatkensis]|uniref:Peptidase M29 n=1 Tax=Gordoniibacillus kamchatkensis TaxID=1590651 RepID=A0ABR5AG61_9BACL|nr:aminopeptidase [Paenibacillus sp. VKM B-2647]KIL39992.1 peptidase M29 [Paenibacillus sp. VKM B-2647]
MTVSTESLHKYAETLLRIGVNLQPGQKLVIDAPLAAAPFVRIVTQHAYDLGASQVHFEWWDDELTLIRYRHAPEASLGYYAEWRADGLAQYAEQNAAFLFIHTPNPELLKDIPAERVAKETRGRSAMRRRYLDYTRLHKVSWVIATTASPAWAEKVYPELPPEQALARLWETILHATRIDRPDPVADWKEHLATLKRKTEQLNAMRIRKLHYRAPGTDLFIELPEKHIWLGGAKPNAAGTLFVANMPTEEVFTLPAKDGVNGVVRSTKPLNYGGSLIDDFSFTFKDGRIAGFQAGKGEDKLKTIVETDEGSRYLGEVALVPHHSPLSMLDTIFYNTLFDENASCHLAIGNAYPSNLEGGKTMSAEQLAAHRVNSSLMHVDFMIGSPELDIDAELPDGSTVPLFRRGD